MLTFLTIHFNAHCVCSRITRLNYGRCQVKILVLSLPRFSFPTGTMLNAVDEPSINMFVGYRSDDLTPFTLENILSNGPYQYATSALSYALASILLSQNLNMRQKVQRCVRKSISHILLFSNYSKLLGMVPLMFL